MVEKFSYFLKSTSLHGLKYLVDETKIGWKKIFAKIFWSFFIGLSFVIMVIILRRSFEKGFQSTSLSLDTNYLDWNNSFPAVSICLGKGRSTSPFKQFFGDSFVRLDGSKSKLSIRHFRVLQSILFLNYDHPMDSISLDRCFDMNDTCGVDMKLIQNHFLPKLCHEFMDSVYFLSDEVNCSDIFERINYKHEICFTTNSLYSKTYNSQENYEDFGSLPLKYLSSDRREKSLEIHLKESDFYKYRLFIHSPEEMPHDADLFDSKNGKLNEYLIKTVEFHNRDDVKFESLEQRECRFPYERIAPFNMPFNTNLCRFIKRAENELKICNCTFPFGYLMNQNLQACNVSQFECLQTLNDKDLISIKSKNYVIEHLSDCLVPTCINMEIVKIGITELEVKNDKNRDITILKIKVLDPTLRYIRRVVMDRLDLIGEQRYPESNQ
ncbi:unnamed protein product [Chironomus riparius]|uniref:Uncharacterized protein n=1 Tax=Chironomus riparius TaxID=315576 RepID=A0A9N9RI60_9DIPT|nr:unnamed protein product [Chironomus riparius]